MKLTRLLRMPLIMSRKSLMITKPTKLMPTAREEIKIRKCNAILSDDQIAELKNRINRSRKIRSAKPNGCVVGQSYSSGRSTDTRLLGQ